MRILHYIVIRSIPDTENILAVEMKKDYFQQINSFCIGAAGMKWRLTSRVLCDKKVPSKLKG